MEFVAWKLIIVQMSGCLGEMMLSWTGPKRTMLQIISTLSIHDACVVELKRSLWIAYMKELENTSRQARGYIYSTFQQCLSTNSGRQLKVGTSSVPADKLATETKLKRLLESK
jgi:hypothetical protein